MALSDAKPFAVAAYALDEASGNALDQVGSLDLTDNATVGAGTGKIDGARDFESGSTEYFSRADNATHSAGDIKFLIRAWVQFESKAATAVIVSKWGDEYLLYYDSSTDRLRFFVSDGTTFTVVSADNFGSPSTGAWYLVHAWHDPDANQIGIAVNAGSANTAAHSAGIKDGTAAFRIGASDSPAPFDGLIDDVVILKGYLLDATERTEDYNGGDGVAFADWDAASGYTLVADSGSFTLAGTAASLEYGRKLAAASGSYALAGQAANLLCARIVAAATGQYTLAGQDAVVRPARRLSAATGSYSLTGQSAGLVYTPPLAASVDGFPILTEDGWPILLEDGFELLLETIIGVTCVHGSDFAVTEVRGHDFALIQVRGNDRPLWEVHGHDEAC